MLHPFRMKQRDLKNPSCRISSEMRQEKNASAFFDRTVRFFDQLRVIRFEGRLCRPSHCRGFDKPLHYQRSVDAILLLLKLPFGQFLGTQSRRMLHPFRMKQRDLKNPSCRILSEMRQGENASASFDFPKVLDRNRGVLRYFHWSVRISWSIQSWMTSFISFLLMPGW
jgi:hypothetical protein